MKLLAIATYPLVGFGILLLLPGQAYAACSQWDMPSALSITQSNDAGIDISTTPSEGGFTGTASHPYLSDGGFGQGQDVQIVRGLMEGAVEGSSVHFTIHWSRDEYKDVDNATGVYEGTIGPQGRLSGTAYRAENPAEKATWWANEILLCRVSAEPSTSGAAVPLGSKQGTPAVPLGRKQGAPAVPLGRIQVVSPLQPPICESARSARARGSPAAPNLEKQCAAAGGPRSAPIAEPAEGAVQPPICESARSARARGSPAAPNLERQCEAAGGPIPVPAVGPAVPGPNDTVEKAPDASSSATSAICTAAREARDGGLASAANLEALCRGDGGWAPPATDTSVGRRVASAPVAPGFDRVRYRATLRITSDTCPFNDFSTSKSADIEAIITPSQLLLPLPLFASIFDRPVNLNRSGRSLSYDGLVGINGGMMPPQAPARFYGGTLYEDLNSFDVRFDVTGLCTISGTVMGSRIQL